MLNTKSSTACITKVWLCACASTLAFGVTEAAAQSSPPAAQANTEVEQVIVTARRKEENLQSVPVSVAAVSAESLQRQTIRSVFDLQRVAPGLTVSPSALGITRPAYQIRGQRTAATRITGDPAIVVYFAEVGSARAAGSGQSLFDVDSVQVLKGPQGTLFGRNTTGGAILITPKAPTGEFEGYGLVSLGNYNHRTYEGVVNLPLGEKAALRVGAQVHRRDGWFHNVVRPGDKAFDEDYSSYRVSLRLKPTDNITSDTIATYFYSNFTGFQTKIDAFNPLTFPIAALAPAVQADLAATQALGYYEFRAKVPSRFKDDVKGIQNTTVFDLGDGGSLLGDARIKNIAAYRKIKNYYTASTDGTSLGIFDSRGTFRGKQFSEELQLQGENSFVDYVLGAFYSKESGTDLQNLISFGALPRNFTEPYGRNTSASVFAHGNFKLDSVAEGLSLSAGARYTKDKRFVDTHNRQIRVPTAANPAQFLCTAPAVPFALTSIDDTTTCSVKTRASFSEPTWDISLNWQFDPDHLVYAAHRHGYRSGVAATGASGLIRPEKVNDLEVGSKNQFRVGDTSMRLNVTGYYGWYKDLQRNVAIILNGQAGTADLNAAKAHVYGIESEFNVRFNQMLSINAAYTLTEAKYDEYANTFNTPTGPVVVDNTSAIFSYTPKHMISANVNLDIPMEASKGAATLSLGYSYQSSIQSNDSNTLNCGPNGIEKWCLNTGPGRTPGYGLVNGRAEWRRPFGAGFDVAVFGTNLLDKKYEAGTITLINVIGVSASYPGAPRMVGVELRVPFGAEQ